MLCRILRFTRTEHVRPKPLRCYRSASHPGKPSGESWAGPTVTVEHLGQVRDGGLNADCQVPLLGCRQSGPVGLHLIHKRRE